MSKDELFQYLSLLVQKNGPDAEDYKKLNPWMNFVADFKKKGILSKEDLLLLRQIWGEAISSDTCQGFALLKPYGYPGDFEILDRIYTNYISKKAHIAKWDKYFHHHKAPQAVRNRTNHLQKIILNQLKTKKEIVILNIGSGPGRDMYAFFKTVHASVRKRVSFECLEQDERAIRYALALCAKYIDQITFKQGNLLRFNATGEYDIVWASGIFDYFKDQIFKRQLKKLLLILKTGGECVIGNFSTNNPSRNYMEIFEWNLYHRTPNELRTIALQCGVKKNNISIHKDKSGVNLFLHVKNRPV